MLSKKNYREDGFTLIEILVVIGIIGILTSVAVPVYLNQTRKADLNSVKSDINNAVILIEQEKSRTGVYPTTVPTQANGTTATGTELKSRGVTLNIVQLPNRVEPTVCVQGSHIDHPEPQNKWYYIIAEKRLTQGTCPTA